MIVSRQGSSRGRSCVPVVLVFFLSSLSVAWGNPSGASVRHGDIRFLSQGDALRVIQNSNRGIIDWNSFSIDNGQTTSFVVPDSRSATLNRVTGATVSRIDGALRSNGQVFLLNPNGVVVGRNGVIDVAGFTASTLDISNEDFLAGGDLRFRGDSQAAVVNLGAISAFDGDIFLIASTVDNAGLLRASDGTAALAAGNDVLIKESGSERVFVRGASGEKKADGVVNTGTIEANVAELKSYGGNVYGMAVKNEGRVAATAVTREGGQIFLRVGGGKVRSTGSLVAKQPARPKGGQVVVDAGKDGTVEVGGTIGAGSGTGVGGTVTVLGERVDVFEGSLILADGEAGGGEIRIGGGRRGEDPLLANAENVTIEDGVLFDASARRTGNGGEIIVFAENTLDFNGHAASRGGAEGGNGGFVEVSGKKALYLPGLVQSVDVSASNGEGGTFLIDPTDVTILRIGHPDDITVSPTSNPSILDSDLQNFLQNTGSLVIQTDSEGTENGDVYVTYGSTIHWTSNNSLSIVADSKIFVDSQVSIVTSGSGNILLDGAKGVDLGNSSAHPGDMTTISTGGVGNLTVRNDSQAADSEGISIWNASLLTDEGDISIKGNSRFNGRRGVEIQESQLSAGGGSVLVEGLSEVAHGVFIGGSQIGSTGGGDVDITGRVIVSNFDHDGILIDDGAAVNETTISAAENANISLAGEGTGQGGMAIQFEMPSSTRVNPFVGGDGTQNVAFDSLGGNVSVSYVDGNQVQFTDPDGVGQSFTAQHSNFGSFTAMNVGAVDVQVDQAIDIQDIKLAAYADFLVLSGNATVTGPVDAGDRFQIEMGPGNTSDIGISAPLVAPTKSFIGEGPSGNRILTKGTFELEGVTFTAINEVRGVDSGNDMLIDSGLDSQINISSETFADPVGVSANIRGIEFNGYDVISGGEGNDNFVIDIDDGNSSDVLLDGAGGDDTFSFSLGGSVDTIIGGDGLDKVDYSAFQSSVFADFGSKSGTQVANFDSLESVIGGQAEDLLTGTEQGDTFLILSDGAGRLNDIQFSNFETLDGAGGDDTFSFLPGGSVDTIIGGDGFDTFDYSAFESSVFADFGSKSGTQVANFDSLESVIGGQEEDRLTGTDQGDSFQILSDGAGYLNDIKFSNFETLDGAGGDDQFVFFDQAMVNQVIGGADLDELVLDDRNLGGVNRYTITNDTISRNPTYNYSEVEKLKLLLGPGDDTVVFRRGNGISLLLDGGSGFDTLAAGSKRFLQTGPFQLEGSTVVVENFEAPEKNDNPRPGGDTEVNLTQQTGKVQNPSLKNGEGGKVTDQFTDNRDGSGRSPVENLMGLSNNPGGNAFGAAAASIIAGQAAVIMIDSDEYQLGAPASLDGTFSLPPVDATKGLRDSLAPDAWNELAAAIEFAGGMVLIMPDGPIAIDLGQALPAEIAPLMVDNLNADAAKELSAALEMAITIPLTSYDGAISIAVVPAAIAPEVAALLAEHIGDAAFAELTEALDSE
ncbi:filamentous hemagglutinin N-terminal domain-containing protein [Verrucomicrobiales bacterium]|nr:filamentous hemagglutinin N-terminal domain-containing protein [Verrucomicrobiales bacterium]